jgi:hypothetical protein
LRASSLRVALWSLLALLAVLAVFAAGKGLERGSVRFLERSLSGKLGVPVTVEDLGLGGTGLEARGIRAAPGDRGIGLALDRVSVAWNRIDIVGGDIVLGDRAVFYGFQNQRSAGESARSGRRSWWSPDVVRFERISISLESREGARKLGTIRGEIDRGEDGTSGHIAASMESLEAEGRLSSSGGESRAARSSSGAEAWLRIRRRARSSTSRSRSDEPIARE